MRTSPSARGGRGRVRNPHRAERGAAALILTMALFFASLLAFLYVNRNLVADQRSSADQYRATQAFEAAEAGIEWALALLNDPRPIGANCLPTTDITAASFRSRYVGAADASFRFNPATWLQGGVAAPLQAACVLADGAWTCDCPASGRPSLATPSGTAPAPAFTLHFLASATPGVVRLASTGCSSLAGPCAPDTATKADATANVAIEIGSLPALRSAPEATLTTRGAFDADTARIGLGNADPATGLALQSGGPIAATSTRFFGPPGASLANLLVGDDPTLAALSTDRFFASYFGLSKAAWKGQPLVQHVRCNLDCGNALLAAIAAARDGASIWVDGDLRVAGPLTLGTAQEPVTIVVEGAAQFSGAVALEGLLYAGTIQWNAAAAGASVYGAAISEDRYSGDAAPDLVYDTAVLATLKTRPAAFARVSGSWHDQ
jgi:hypothetical protein